MSNYIDIVFDGPPSHDSGRFVEVEDSDGVSVQFGEWVEREDGYWALRISGDDTSSVLMDDDLLARVFFEGGFRLPSVMVTGGIVETDDGTIVIIDGDEYDGESE